MIGQYKGRELYIELRPKCPKCRKEFLLDLKRFTPGRAHSCYACGTVAQFDSPLAEKVQKLLGDLQTSIEEVFESFSRHKG